MKKLLLTLVGVICALNMWAQDNVQFGMSVNLSETSKDENATETFESSSTKVSVTRSVGSKVTVYNTGDKGMNQGSTTAYYSIPCYRIAAAITDYDNDIWVGYKVVVSKGYSVDLTNIKASIAASANITWKVSVEKEDGTVIVSSDGKTVSNYKGNTTNMSIDKNIDVKDVEGTFYVKAYYYLDGTGKYLTFPQLQISGTLNEKQVTEQITLIRADLKGGSTTPDVTGVYAGSAVAKTQTPDTNGGCKLGSNGHYVGITLADGQKFKTGDVLHIFITQKNSGGSTLALYSDLGENFICDTGIYQETSDVTFTLTDDFNDLSTFYLYRSSEYSWNGYVKSVYVTREIVVAPITISGAGYATYVAPYALDFTDSEITAYAVVPDLANDKVILTPQTKVPAGKAIVVKGDQGTCNIPAIASADDFETALEVSDAATAYDNVNTYYYLGVDNGVVGFRPLAEGGSIAAGKCFFKVSKTPDAAPRFFSMSFGEATAIKAVENATNNAVRYNLAGQRVNANAKGIIIVNGKKMLNK